VNKIIKFTVSVPTDKGFIGRACNNPDCEQYFKISADARKKVMYCPYCASQFNEGELHTTDQVEYLSKAVEAEAETYVHNELQKMLKKTFGSSSAKKPGISFKTSRVQKREFSPHYQERKIDSELICPSCETKFQVYGVFGFCPGCKEENMLVYDANLSIIESEISYAKNPERQLRHAYGDLVSTFETLCKRKAKKLTSETCNFQVLFDSRKFFKTHGGLNILSNVPKNELLALRRLFQKRHLYMHSDGTITEKYIRKIPEDSTLLNEKAALSLEEFKLASVGMRIALMDLVKSIEKKG